VDHTIQLLTAIASLASSLVGTVGLVAAALRVLRRERDAAAAEDLNQILELLGHLPHASTHHDAPHQEVAPEHPKAEEL
jgi:hypothetical protein